MDARRKKFIDEYLVDLNGTQAVIRAGYSEKGASVQGARLLANASIRAEIEKRKAELSQRTLITAERVVGRLAEIGFADMADFMQVTEDGDAVLDMSALTPAQTAAIQEITTEVYMDGKGDQAERVKKTKIKLHPPIPALQLLGKHLGTFAELHKHQLIGDTSLEVRLIGDSGDGDKS